MLVRPLRSTTFSPPRRARPLCADRQWACCLSSRSASPLALVTDEVPDDAVLDSEPIAGREGLQTNSPGWPGFGSGGYLATASLYLTVNL